jgi:hypothetical protein
MKTSNLIYGGGRGRGGEKLLWPPAYVLDNSNVKWK